MLRQWFLPHIAFNRPLFEHLLKRAANPAQKLDKDMINNKKTNQNKLVGFTQRKA
ncbi:MAG: hypothetical protein ACRCXF_04895 [Plesiomonas shigelloides]